jgi:thiol-disulfide isomerase/thioredoxin
MKDALKPRGQDKEIKVMVKDYQKEMDSKAQRIKSIVEDVQRQQAKDKRIILDECKAESAALRALEGRVAELTQELRNLRTEIENAHRLEKAAEALTTAGDGRAPPPPQGVQGAGEETDSRVDSRRQPATGGLVEMRDGDFDKMLREGDAWVVMWYAPWCAHCKAAEPAFQQVALFVSVT